MRSEVVLVLESFPENYKLVLAMAEPILVDRSYSRCNPPLTAEHHLSPTTLTCETVADGLMPNEQHHPGIPRYLSNIATDSLSQFF